MRAKTSLRRVQRSTRRSFSSLAAAALVTAGLVASGGATSPAGAATTLKGVALLTEGSTHGCAALTNGSIDCWGANDVGEFGNPDAPGPMPAPVSYTPTLVNVVSISAGGGHTCAVTSGHALWCWGFNPSGELGLGDTTKRLVPTFVMSGVSAVSAGEQDTCAVLTSGAVDCWGDNRYGQLGDGTDSGPQTCNLTGACSTSPVAVTGLSGATAVSVGGVHACALANGHAVCWGTNHNGEIGDGTSTDRLTPVRIADPPAPFVWTAISAGGDHTCAVAIVEGYCWGSNQFGQLGDGTTTGSHICGAEPCETAPKLVSGLGTSVVSMSAGLYDTCAVTTAPSVECWGDNAHGQIGDGTTTNRPSPTGVFLGLSVPGIAAISTGQYSHACALLSDGTVKCWGSNTHGELGDGSTTNRSFPVSVIAPAIPGPPTGVTAVSWKTTGATGVLSISFHPPTSVGSTTISNYAATCVSSNGGGTRSTTNWHTSPIVLSGPKTGKSYKCTVKATNSVGTGPASSASTAVIVGSPAASTHVVARRVASGTLKVSFTPGANNGAVVSHYTVACTSTNGGVAKSAIGARSPISVAGLSHNKSYRCTVRGTNSRGTGKASAASAAVTA